MALELKIRGHRVDLRSITVEPLMFLYMFGTFLQFITFQAMLYDKVCNHNFNETVCENLNNASFKSEEEVVQKTTSRWLLYINMTLGIPSLFSVVLFLGPWGDTVGRKVPIIISLIGSCLSTTSCLLNAVYMDASLIYLLIGPLFNGLLGGYIAAMMSMYSYIAHISTPAYRTVKIGILEAMIFLAGTIGTATSGVMLDRTSYVFVFSLLVGTNVLALLYALVWIVNVKPESNEDTDTRGGCCKEVVVSALKDIALCVYHKRNSKNFLNIFLLVIVLFILMVVFTGEGDIILIYTRHAPLEWNQTTLGLFKGTESFLRGIAVLTLLPVCKRIFYARDTTVMMFGLVSKIVSLVILGIGTSTAVLFVGAVCGVLQGFPAAAVRSQCSAMVKSNEQAKMFSLIAMFESIASLVATSLFNTLYNVTFDLYHGFCFLMAAGMAGLCFVIAVVLHMRLMQPDVQNYSNLECEGDEEAIVTEDNN